MEKIHIEEHIITSDYSDYKLECRLSALLGLMQRAADEHIESQGITWHRMKEIGMAWVLSTLEIEFDRIPRYLEKIKIKTWHKGTKGVLWLRDYKIYDSEEKEIARARTSWALVDYEKRKILRPSSFPFEIIENNQDSAGEAPKKISIDHELMEAYNFEVKYSGIDPNGHLNNSRYADLCFDALCNEELDSLRVKGFRITYNREALFGESIYIKRSSLVENKIYIKGVNQVGRDYFNACILFL